MTARNAGTLASLAVLCAVSACTSFFEVPIETPIQPKMDVSAFSRVLIAGFIGGGTDDVDANLETVRLLRSQLRSKSNLRVIEAEVLPLAEIAADQMQKGTNAAPLPEVLPMPGASGDGQQPPQLPPTPPQTAPPTQQQEESSPVRIRNEKDLEKYKAIFADAAFWKKLGEEYQNPLIITGTVLFTPTQTSGFVVRNQEFYDNLGRREVRPVRMWMERKGFVLTPNFIFIDGRTGATLYSERMEESVLYSAQQNTPALSSYFELMDRVIPSFLGTLSMQKIRGTRVLLR